MQRDVKIGIAIGVLLIALVAIFMWTRRDVPQLVMPPGYEASRDRLPAAEEPVAPVGLNTPNDLLGSPEISASEVPMPTRPPVRLGPGRASFQPPAGVPTSVGTVPPREEIPETPVLPAQVVPEVTAQVTHTVEKGDTLTRIARKYYDDGRKWRRILDANKDKISRDVDIRPGMKLLIPNDSTSGTLVPVVIRTTTPEATTQTKHTVAKGEILSKIAARYYGTGTKANVDLIYNKNKSVIGSDRNKLKVGMVLVIPPKD